MKNWKNGATMALLLGLSSAVFAKVPDVDIPFEKFVLDNGLRVIVHEDRKAPVVAVSVWYHVGSKDEPKGRSGFAHLFEHLMFNGSENYDDEFFKPFELVGATGMNGTTWLDRTNYFETVPTPALDMALWMESDRMGHLLGAVTQEKLDEQRGVVQNEKRQGENQPYGRAFEAIQKGLVPEGHPYHHTTIGSMEDLNAASLEDVHEWFKKYYGAANTVLVLAGDIDAQTAQPLVEKYFGDIPAGPPLSHMKNWVVQRTNNTHEVMYDRVPQTRIYRAWGVPGRTTKDSALLNLAANVLGSGKNSRLYQALVYQNQLASNVSTLSFPFELTSLFGIDVMLKPGVSTAQVNAIIDEVMDDFLENGPTADELKRVQSQYNAATIRGLEQVGGFGGKAVTLAQGELYAGDAGFFRKQLQWTNTTSTAEIHQAAKDWLSSGYYQLDVVPYADYSTVASTVDRSQLPAVGNMPDLEFPAIQRARLDNGIEVALAERHTVPVVNMAIQFDAGYSADSVDAKLGTASFTLAMMDEGTKSRDALEISEEAELLGANISTNSNVDMSTVSLSALKTNLGDSVDLFSDIVRNPVFKQSEMDRLRPRWLANITQEKAQPVATALRLLPPLIYGEDHAYGIPLTGSGTEASITELSRDDLIRFHQNWIRPDNATVFVSGDTTLDEILPVLNKAFGKWRAPNAPMPQKNVAEIDLPATGRVVVVDKPDSPQSLILAGHIAPPTGHQDYLTTQSMNEILGGAFTARVNMNLREDKSWAYGAYTFTLDAQGQRPWLVYAPVQTDRTGDSIGELVKEFDEYLGSRPATADELSKVVNNNVNALPGQYETSGAVLGSMLSNARFNRPDNYVTSLKDQYAKLDLEKIQANAEEVLHPKKLTWLIVGDRSQIDEQLKELDIGEITYMDADGNLLK